MDYRIKTPTKDELVKLFDTFDYNHDGVLTVNTELFDLANFEAEENGFDTNSEAFKEAWKEIQKTFDVEHHVLTQDYFVDTILANVDPTITECPELIENHHFSI